MSYAVLFWSVVTAEGLETTASPSTVKPRAQKHERTGLGTPHWRWYSSFSRLISSYLPFFRDFFPGCVLSLSLIRSCCDKATFCSRPSSLLERREKQFCATMDKVDVGRKLPLLLRLMASCFCLSFPRKWLAKYLPGKKNKGDDDN
jgi:hypothetical protein